VTLAHKGGGDLSIMVILVSLLRGNVLMCYSVLNALHKKHGGPVCYFSLLTKTKLSNVTRNSFMAYLRMLPATIRHT